VNNRRSEQIRPSTSFPTSSPTAEGFALIEMGTRASICTASVEETVPAFMRGLRQGWISGEYGMLPALDFDPLHARGGQGKAKWAHAGDSTADWTSLRAGGRV